MRRISCCLCAPKSQVAYPRNSVVALYLQVACAGFIARAQIASLAHINQVAEVSSAILSGEIRTALCVAPAAGKTSA